MKLSGDSESFTIDKTILDGIEETRLPDEINVSIYYHEDGETEDELISDKMVIVPISNNIK